MIVAIGVKVSTTVCIEEHRGQAAASREGTVADAGHRVADGDGGQATAIIEGRVADAGHSLFCCST